MGEQHRRLATPRYRGGLLLAGFREHCPCRVRKIRRTRITVKHTEPVLRTPIRKSGRHSVCLAAGETQSYDCAFVPEPVPLTHEADLKADVCECSTMV